MKIGILTQPLSGNYGGLLQCYALQSVLKTFGHEVWIVQRETETQLTGLGRFFYYAKQILKTCLGGDFVRLSDPKKKST